MRVYALSSKDTRGPSETDMEFVDEHVWIPAPQAAAELGICRRILSRWLADPELAFPWPKIVRGRVYFSRDALNFWKAAADVRDTAKE